MSGVKRVKFDLEMLLDAEMQGGIGYCIQCGAQGEDDWYEPDARKRRCMACNACTVYGVEEIMAMGLISEE